jgi:hypothetical protein
MHVSWHHALDTKHGHILAKFEHRLSISVLKNKTFFTKKALSHPFGKRFVSLFSPKLYEQPVLKYDKSISYLVSIA